MNPAPSRPPRRLVPFPLRLNSDEFRQIQGWVYPTEPFYIDQVRRAIQSDIPQLVTFHDCALWGYRDPDAGGDLVAFGTLQITDLYADRAAGKNHCYIPLLSARPGAKGYGPPIMDHLIAEAAILVRQHQGTLSDQLFLDVYVANDTASDRYVTAGFTILNPTTPIPDEAERNEPYYVMAKNITVASVSPVKPMPSTRPPS